MVVVEEHLFDLIGVVFGEVVSGGGTAYYVDVDVSAKKVLIDIDASDVAKWDHLLINPNEMRIAFSDGAVFQHITQPSQSVLMLAGWLSNTQRNQ